MKKECKKIILVGGGGHCKSVIDVAECIGCQIIGVIDPFKHKGDYVLGYRVLGGDETIKDYVKEANFVITVGFITDSKVRKQLYDKVLAVGGSLATLVSPYAYVSRYAMLGDGTVVMHHACVNAGSVIGNNVIINTYANIEHDVIIGDNSHISTGAMVNGNCNIGKGVFIGSQSVLLNQVFICDNTIIGAGSVVNKSILSEGVYCGNPIKFLRINGK